MTDQIISGRYSYFVNTMLFLFTLFVNINNTAADVVLFSLSIVGMYVLKKKNINPFKDSRLKLVLIITAGYYFINLVIFFINGTNFAKYIQTDLYFLLAVFVAAAILYAEVNISVFFSGIRMALVFLGVCHFFHFYPSNIYISIFAPVTVLMMFLSIINFDNDNLINKIFGLTAFILGMNLIIDSPNNIRLSWIVFIILMIVVSFLMFKKIAVNRLSLIVSILLLSVFVSLVNSHNWASSHLTSTLSDISNWNSGKNIQSTVGIRLEMYSSGLEAFKAKPFFGHGYLNGTKEASKYADPSVKDTIRSFVQMHSEYSTTMVEKGMFGLLSLSMLLLLPVFSIVRNYSKNDVYIRIGIVTIISFILFGLFNASFGDTTIKAFYMLLICLILPKLHKENFS